MFHPGQSENARPDGHGVLEVVGERDEGTPRFVPLRRTELAGEVAGPLAALRLTQAFGFDAEVFDRPIEAAYRFPLPGDAAVTGVRVRFGSAQVRAELCGRDEAGKKYKKARAEGRQAALLTREDASVFTLQVAGIGPGEEVTVETAFVLLARADGPGWSLRVPLTTAPRYVRADEAGSRAADAQPLGLLRDPGHRFALDLAFRDAGAVASPTHDLETSRDGGRLRVRLAGGEVVPDRDCLLNWSPVAAADRPTLRIEAFGGPDDEHAHLLALVAPPATRDPGARAAREVVLLVDHSGSMEGPKWAAADWAVETFLSGLAPSDAFALGVFHYTTRWHGEGLRQATPEAIAEAVAWMKAARDQGGTELGVALEQALRIGRTPGEAARHVLLVTDAEVADAGRLLRLARAESARPDRRRISLLCIDAAPNAALADALAEAGGGVARYVTSDPDEGDVATALDSVLDDWAEPILTNLTLEVDRPGVLAAGRAVAKAGGGAGSTIDLGDLPAGRAVWVVARVPRGDGGPIRLRLVAGPGRSTLAEAAVGPADAPAGRAVRAAFGAARVRALESFKEARHGDVDLRDELKQLGFGPGEPPASLYPENDAKQAAKHLRGLIRAEALAAGLASTETAFVAAREEAGQAVAARVDVPNALPAGWSSSFVGGGGGAMLVASLKPRGGGYGSGNHGRGGYGRGGYGGSGYGGGGGYGSYGSPQAASYASMPPAAGEGFAMSRESIADPGELLDDVAASMSGDPTPSQMSSAAAFEGVPAFQAGSAVLLDSDRPEDAARLPADATLTMLSLRYPEGDPGQLDRGLELLIFVDDPAEPRARVRLANLQRGGGVRPLNLRRGSGQLVRIVLLDPAGAWATGAPRIALTLR